MSTYLEHGVLCDGRRVLLTTYRREPDEGVWQGLWCEWAAPHEHHLVTRVVTAGDWSEPLATEVVR